SDLGTKQLRKLLFEETSITGLFSFENRKTIFEGVDSRFKFVVLTFRKGGSTQSFPAAFMRHYVSELDHFPNDDSIVIDIDMVGKLSPDSLSVTEFQNELDLQIAKKLLQYPMLGEELSDTWNFQLFREMDMTNDSDLFETKPASERVRLYEGKMIWHFISQYAEPRYWVDKSKGRKRVIGSRGEDSGQVLDYQQYRFGCRSITGATNERTMVCSIIPRDVFCGNSLLVSKRSEMEISNSELVVFTAVMSGFVVDFALRQAVATQMNMFYIYQTPVPRLSEGDMYFNDILERAGRLICTTSEFDDLAAEIGLGDHKAGVTDEAERLRLRAELDAMIAHIYRLSDREFEHILSTFPLVDDEIKDATLAAYREIEPVLTEDESKALHVSMEHLIDQIQDDDIRDHIERQFEQVMPVDMDSAVFQIGKATENVLKAYFLELVKAGRIFRNGQPLTSQKDRHTNEILGILVENNILLDRNHLDILRKERNVGAHEIRSKDVRDELKVTGEMYIRWHIYYILLFEERIAALRGQS
ncbi:MAG: hypothetical protein AAFQ57_12485, partial [Cyanobacteria bacterium J06626_14]